MNEDAFEGRPFTIQLSLVVFSISQIIVFDECKQLRCFHILDSRRQCEHSLDFLNQPNKNCDALFIVRPSNWFKISHATAIYRKPK